MLRTFELTALPSTAPLCLSSAAHCQNLEPLAPKVAR